MPCAITRSKASRLTALQFVRTNRSSFVWGFKTSAFTPTPVIFVDLRSMLLRCCSFVAISSAVVSSTAQSCSIKRTTLLRWPASIRDLISFAPSSTQPSRFSLSTFPSLALSNASNCSCLSPANRASPSSVNSGRVLLLRLAWDLVVSPFWILQYTKFSRCNDGGTRGKTTLKFWDIVRRWSWVRAVKSMSDTTCPPPQFQCSRVRSLTLGIFANSAA